MTEPEAGRLGLSVSSNMPEGTRLAFERLTDALLISGRIPCEQGPVEAAPITEDDPDPWYSAKSEGHAARLCKGCPVLALCLDYAVEANEKYGVWGGTTPLDRVHIRRGAPPATTSKEPRP
jgi:hypothetical protein